MKRHIPGLHATQQEQQGPLAGCFLVRVARVSYRWHPQKPFFALQFAVLEPKALESRTFSGRLYCTTKALWKLNWFLRDFGYDAELLGRDEVDERQLAGLSGVVKISHIVFNGTSLLRFDGFAPASRWQELSPTNLDSPQVA